MKHIHTIGRSFDVYEKYKRSEINLLHQIEIDCFPPELRLDIKAFAGDLKKAKKDGLLLIVKHELTPVGSLFAEEMGGQGYISNVSVSPLWRGNGIASKMLWLIEGKMRQMGYKESHLEVDTKNPALRLYLKSQYVIDRMIADYYSKGQHALYMIKTL